MCGHLATDLRVWTDKYVDHTEIFNETKTPVDCC